MACRAFLTATRVPGVAAVLIFGCTGSLPGTDGIGGSPGGSGVGGAGAGLPVSTDGGTSPAGASGAGGSGAGAGAGGAGGSGGVGAAGAGGRPTGGGGTGGGGTGGGGAGGAGAGGQGTAGTGGLPTVPDNGCNVRLADAPAGFAALAGGTVGGGSVAPILVTTAAQLQTLLGDNQPRVLYVMNDLDLRTANRGGVTTCADNTPCDNGSGMLIDEPRVSTTCDATEHAATSFRNETTVRVASNKTLIGIGQGAGATIRGASLAVGASTQVIIRNLTIRDVNPHLVEAGDGITLQGATHVWIDHVGFTQISDGFVDIGSADHSTIDNNVTLSWIHFDGRTAFQCGGQHSFVNFVDNGRITYHHNFYDNTSGRNPKISGASSQVHLFNNYWLNVTYFCITAQVDSQARVESNTFENSSRPHWLQLDGNGTAGIAIDAGNVYTGASTGNTNRDSGGVVFAVPYPYAKGNATTERQAIIACAGPQPIR